MADNKNISVEEQEKRVFAHQQRITELEGQLAVLVDELQDMVTVYFGLSKPHVDACTCAACHAKKALTYTAPFVAAYKAKVRQEVLEELIAKTRPYADLILRGQRYVLEDWLRSQI